jgi:hypothetical protein
LKTIVVRTISRLLFYIVWAMPGKATIKRTQQATSCKNLAPTLAATGKRRVAGKPKKHLIHDQYPFQLR